MTCPVCDGLRRVRLVKMLAPNLRGRGVHTCPRCRPEPWREPMPVWPGPVRVDVPGRALFGAPAATGAGQ